MDSLSQIALGAAVSVAAMGRRTATWKAAAWGAVAGTLPDLDVLIDHGDPLLNMVLHRAESHALLWLTLASLPLAAAVAALQREWGLWRRWWLAIGLALVTHPLLDAMTVYGTQLALPFTDHPYGVGSVFIIDPLYTLPLLLGTGWACWAGARPSGGRANALGLLLSTAYLGWSVLAQQQVERVARDALARQGIAAERVLVTPGAFTTLMWRVVAIESTQYHEGFYSLLDPPPPPGAPAIRFDAFARGTPAAPALAALDPVRRLAAFSHGFYALELRDGRWTVIDLRLGQRPGYLFSFAVARQDEQGRVTALQPTQQVGERPSADRLLPWWWQRVRGRTTEPPPR